MRLVVIFLNSFCSVWPACIRFLYDRKEIYLQLHSYVLKAASHPFLFSYLSRSHPAGMPRHADMQANNQSTTFLAATRGQALKIVLTHSWLNLNRAGDSNALHSHPGSHLSGVYYVDIGSTTRLPLEDSHRQRRSCEASWAGAHLKLHSPVPRSVRGEVRAAKTSTTQDGPRDSPPAVEEHGREGRGEGDTCRTDVEDASDSSCDSCPPPLPWLSVSEDHRWSSSGREDASTVTMRTESGVFIIFPSWLTHHVPPYNPMKDDGHTPTSGMSAGTDLDSTRISVAFNARLEVIAKDSVGVPGSSGPLPHSEMALPLLVPERHRWV